jgi:hypothetical protein
MEISTFLPTAIGQFHLLSYWLAAYISQQLSYTLLALPNGCPIAFKSISQRLSAKTWQFLSFSLKGRVSFNICRSI